jgi:Uma2 family endonuclease
MGRLEPPELLRRHRVTVDDYYRMAEVGLFAPDARVELIEGEIVDMASIGSRHASMVRRLTSAFFDAGRDRMTLSVQAPVRLGAMSEPEPDLMLLKPREDFYAEDHPVAADVLLLVEVSDTTARYDREIKTPLYARHAVPEVWIIDLDNKRVRVMREPENGEYSEISETASPGFMEPKLLPGVRIDLSGIFN